MKETFEVGDRVTWETQMRGKGGIVTTPLTGNVTQVGKGAVVVNYAPNKFRQVTVGTLNLRKVAPQVAEVVEVEDAELPG